jgi:Protein of unknown function (DUF3606)
MRRARPQSIRNKVDLSDPAQMRAWSKRLEITADNLQRIAGIVGNSIAAISKEIELRKAPAPLKPASPPVQIDPASLPAIETVVAEVQSAAMTGS